MSLGVVLLAAYMAISDGNYQIDERIERTLLEAVHILDERVSIRAGHYGKMSIDETQRQVVHVFGAETNEVLLLTKRRAQTYDYAYIAPQLVRALVLHYEVFEYVKSVLAVVFEDASDETRERNRLVPVHAFVDERQHGRAHRVCEQTVVVLEVDERLAQLEVNVECVILKT